MKKSPYTPSNLTEEVEMWLQSFLHSTLDGAISLTPWQFNPRDRTKCPTEEETGWVLDPVWTFWRRERVPAPVVRHSSPGSPGPWQYRLGCPRSCSTTAPTNNTMTLLQVRTHATNENTKRQPHTAASSLAAPTVSNRLIRRPAFYGNSSFKISRRRIKHK